MTRRRKFIGLLGGAAVCPLEVSAQHGLPAVRLSRCGAETS